MAERDYAALGRATGWRSSNDGTFHDGKLGGYRYPYESIGDAADALKAWVAKAPPREARRAVLSVGMSSDCMLLVRGFKEAVGFGDDLPNAICRALEAYGRALMEK